MSRTERLDLRGLLAGVDSLLAEVAGEPWGVRVASRAIRLRARIAEVLDRSGPANLDGMDETELRQFHAKWRYATAAEAAALFPFQKRGRRQAARRLAVYALHKALAMGGRQVGMIQWALMEEAECDKIYEQLPSWARW